MLLGLVLVIAAIVVPSARATTTPEYMPGTPLKIPYSATVLTLSGLNFNLYNNQPAKFQGVFSRAPYTMVKVDYPASLATNSITKGVAALDAALKAHPGQKIVLAQSQGAQVVSRWLRVHGSDTDAPAADEVTFILTGNPLRSNGGGGAIGKKEVDGTVGIPTLTDTTWPIIDVARRYDGWADSPQDTTNLHAVENADTGKNTMHMGYDDVDITAPTHTISQYGNTTYVLTKEDVLPMWKDRDDVTPAVMAAMQRHIERAYDRPSNDPKVFVPAINSSLWTGILTNLGVDPSPTTTSSVDAPPSDVQPPATTPVPTSPKPVTPPPSPKPVKIPTKATTPVIREDVEAPDLTKVVLVGKLDQFVRKFKGTVRITSSEQGLVTAKLVVTVRYPAARRGAAPRTVELTVAQRNLAAISAGVSSMEVRSTFGQALALKRALAVKGVKILRTDLHGVVLDAAKNRDRFDIRVR